MGTHENVTPCGRRLLLHVLEDTAQQEPNRHLISIPNSTSDPRQGWRVLSFYQVVNGMNHAAHWLEATLGRPEPKSFPTLAYIGLGDARYILLALAAIKVFLPSPRNNSEAIASLFEATKVKYLLYGSELSQLALTCAKHTSTAGHEVPSIANFIRADVAASYLYNESFATGCADPTVILHTSGTTGIPKPVVIRNGLFAAIDNYRNYPTLHGFELHSYAKQRLARMPFSPMPLFHAFGLLKFITDAILFNIPFAIPPAERPITGDLILECLRFSGADALAATPSMLNELVALPGGIDVLENLGYVVNAGGRLQRHTLGVFRKQAVTLINDIGSTETGPFPLYYQPEPENWDYFIINDELLGAEYTALQDTIYEQKIVRKHNPDAIQATFFTFPEKVEYKTGDIYRAHPTLPNQWKHEGRIDNIMVLSTGEKLNPVTMEAIACQHPEVNNALVVGDGQFQAGIILEPISWPDDGKQKEALIERVWPQIDQANDATVRHGRVARNFIILANKEKPFPYTAKGSLQRRVAMELYADEIEGLYRKQNEIAPAQLDAETLQSLRDSVSAMLHSMLDGTMIGDNDDFLLNGIDSLQVINTSGKLTAWLKEIGAQENLAIVEPRDIYEQKTIANLSVFLFNKVHGTTPQRVVNVDTAFMQGLIDKYSMGLDGLRNNRPPSRTWNKTVLLTGSTGSLGSYMLHSLINSPDVHKIICLDRSLDGGHSKQIQSSANRALSAVFEKVTFLHADVSRPNLDLSPTDLQSPRETDCIIHTAWPVNFNLAIQSFENHIRGVRHLLNVASNTVRNASMIFISTIATVANWADEIPVPETHLADLELTGRGYGESKLISSHILHNAAQRASLPIAIVRLGQVAGPTTQAGEWNPQEWFPALIDTSVRLGVLPNSLGSQSSIAWLPVDTAARVIIDVANFIFTAPQSSEAHYFNLVNPTSAEWIDVLPAVVMFHKQKGKMLKLVSMQDWIEAVRKAPPSAVLAGYKLLDTFQSMADESTDRRRFFSTEKSQSVSETLANTGPVTPELMTLWCQQWNFAG